MLYVGGYTTNTEARRRDAGPNPGGAATVLAGALVLSLAIPAGSLSLDDDWGARPEALRPWQVAQALAGQGVAPGSRIASDDNWR